MKQYADTRIKMSNRLSPETGSRQFSPNRDDEKVSVPSEISDDMWGELPKYQYKLHLDQLKKAKEDIKRKKQLIKTTLDTQLKEQQEKRQRDLAAAKEIDRQMLVRAQNELDEEKRRKERVKMRTIEQKGARDVMLKEAIAMKE